MPDKRKLRRKPFTLKQVQKVSTHALDRVLNILLHDQSSNNEVLRAASVIAQLSNAYRSTHELADLEERIRQLENAEKETT